MNDQQPKMSVTFTLRHSHSEHEDVKQYAQHAVLEFGKFYDNITSCAIILDHQKHSVEENKLCEITIHIPKKDFVAKCGTDTYKKSIDKCVASISRQLVEYKNMK